MRELGVWTRAAVTGAACGLLNGLFGAGGGMAAVPLLKAGGLPQKKAHATSLAVILPLAAVSAAFYLLDGALSFREAVPYLPGGFLGACAGALLMKRIPSGVLRRVFGALLLIAGVRLLLR
ncbi:MAG: sulfite exporter TauE/SafE family protein [Clostridiales bacterium]|nr:sulfite exporter TauE/SafE family protein [Clostridiales bacterium]